MTIASRASLQMYLRPETEGATRAFWHRIRAAYGGGDPELTTYDPIEAAWDDPALLLSQTCGLPYRLGLKDRVRLVGTPDYGLPGCPPGYYFSCLLVRADDPRQDLAAFRTAPLAVNTVYSQSGWAALLNHLAEAGAGFDRPENTIRTGSHLASARAVAEGRADLASIDAVTWALLLRYEAFAQDLRVLLTTRPTPGLPYITGKTVDPAPLLAATECAIAALSDAERDRLMLRGIAQIPAADYLAVPVPECLTLPA